MVTTRNFGVIPDKANAVGILAMKTCTDIDSKIVSMNV
jgi:hypothetical protein